MHCFTVSYGDDLLNNLSTVSNNNTYSETVPLLQSFSSDINRLQK